MAERGKVLTTAASGRGGQGRRSATILLVVGLTEEMLIPLAPATPCIATRGESNILISLCLNMYCSSQGGILKLGAWAVLEEMTT